MRLDDLSRVLHKAITGQDMAFCARAWKHRTHCGWRLYIAVIDFFDRGHCERSYRRYHP